MTFAAVDVSPASASTERDPGELTRLGGEFRAAKTEAIFQHEGRAESFRHARVLLIASVILNSLFFISDWRFHGQPHFFVAIPARAVVVAIALLCLHALRSASTPRDLTRIMLAWMTVNGLAVAALVSSHSDIALFVVIMLPLIYYLAVPVPFRWVLTSGCACSVALLISYTWLGRGATEPGLFLASLILNSALAIVVSRWNRLARLAWAAARAARASATLLQESRETLERVFSASPVPLAVTRHADGGIVRYNAGCAALFGLPAEPDSADSFNRFYVHPFERERLVSVLDAQGVVDDFETEMRAADGSVRTFLLKASTVDLPGGKVIIAGIIDISDRKAVERSLEWLASTDALTRLPNRLSFFSQGRAEMMRAARNRRPLSLLMIDLDHFKSINDRFGHRGGDQALRAFAALCTSFLRSGDFVGRLGGEEFGILTPETDVEGAVMLAEALRAAVEELEVAELEGTRLTISIGVSAIQTGESDIDLALARADLALYAAKHGGRNRVHSLIADPGSAQVSA